MYVFYDGSKGVSRIEGKEGAASKDVMYRNAKSSVAETLSLEERDSCPCRIVKDLPESCD